MPWRSRAQSLGHLGKYEEAIECYNKSLEINPNDAIIYCNKDVSLEDLGKYEVDDCKISLQWIMKDSN